MRLVGLTRLMCLFSLVGLFSTPLSSGKEPYTSFDFSKEPSLAMLKETKFTAVNRNVTDHKVEQRGFVSVPMDYSRKETSPTLKIFYRLIPLHGSRISDTKAPLLVVINGGPGIPSSAYRSYDYDYDKPTEQMTKSDQLAELSKHFRILIIDQRGTPGYSAPLDMTDKNLNPGVIAQYFDSYHIALDHQEVIKAVLLPDEPFYMLAQSYGGMVGMRYLTLAQITLHPKGMIFSSSALPNQDPFKMMGSRRESQRKLNEALFTAVPEIKQMLANLAEHFKSNGVKPESINYLWSLLGRGPNGKWEMALKTQIETLLKADKKGIQTYLDQEVSRADILNYILSSKEITPGYTDRTVGKVVVARVPFEKWMIDEEWTLSQITGESEWVNPLLDAIDRKPPPLLPTFPSNEEIRKQLAQYHVLFTIGQGDAYLEEDTTRRHAEKFISKGRGSIRTLAGGHKAAFLKDGAEVVASWAESIR